jgi:hypothetical protein
MLRRTRKLTRGPSWPASLLPPFLAFSLAFAAFLLLAGVVQAEDGKDEKLLSGMSILGNDEAPKSLVIVPWKSSLLGDDLDLSRILDDGMRPVDKDVFLRELDYYQIREASHSAD